MRMAVNDGRFNPPPGLVQRPKSNLPSPAGGISDTLKQLLDLSPAEQLRALNKLSQEVPSWSPAGPPGLAPRSMRSVSAHDPTWSPDAKAYPMPCPYRGGYDGGAGEPMKVEVPGLGLPAVALDEAEQQKQLGQAFAELQLAMTKWEAATKHFHGNVEPAKPRARTAASSRTSLAAAATCAPSLHTMTEEAGAIGFARMRAEDLSEALNQNSCQDGSQTLHRIVGNLLGMARSEVAAVGPTVAQKVQASELVRWCLEEQQAKSMEKINLMMQSQGGAAWPSLGADHAGVGVDVDDRAPAAAAQRWWPPSSRISQQSQTPGGAEYQKWAVQHHSNVVAPHLNAYGALGHHAQDLSHLPSFQTVAIKSQGRPQTLHLGPRGGGHGHGPEGRVRPSVPGQGARGKAFAVPSENGIVEEDTLRKHLRELQYTNPRKVLVIRKMKGLGLEAAAALRSHYSKYGDVEHVYVAHSYVKPRRGNGAARLRPSSPAFLVMAREEDADAILKDGEQHEVHGAVIDVHPFEHRGLGDANAAALRGG